MATSINFPTLTRKPSFPLKEKYIDGVLRVTFENLTEQTRNKVTRRTKEYPEVTYPIMSDTDHTALMNFYNSTTDGGALSFNWTHPYTGAVKEVRFTGPPDESLEGPNRWNVSFGLREV